MGPALGEQFTRRRQRWEAGEIVGAIQAWEERYGEVPTSLDWNPTLARRLAGKHAARSRRWAQAVQRFESDEWPWQASVTRAFGTWNDAITAAGFTPRRSTTASDTVPLDPGELHRFVAMIDQALDQERPNTLRAVLVELAERAHAWAEELDRG